MNKNVVADVLSKWKTFANVDLLHRRWKRSP